MGKKVAGTAYIKADGTQFTTTGGAEAPLSSTKRETVAVGFFKEEDRVPFIKATVVNDPDLPIDKIMNATDQTVTFEFGNGTTYVLSGAYIVDEPIAKGDDGTIDLNWEGTKGVWL
ncbi:phage tail tube protein [Pseudomonas cremoricolorata]|uniref:Phage tail protein n=1 Tax=Pseudomonas cremoricolorata TaxID=157783 RepID=A0A089WPS5_9PSED|nr:phage tail tube protein [Pseudomonas cremoricolorata]AIR90586.1 phage tail protein [Pseudomonas cremoricolorata]